MFINTISESKYQTFKQCNFKYRYRYIDSLKEDTSTNADALHFGSYIHKIFEDGVKATTVEELMSLSEELKSNYSFNSSYNPKIEVCAKNFLRFNASLETNDITELRYSIDVKEDISVNGIIDRVVRGKQGGLLIVDYKTSKREKTKFDLYQDTQMKGYCYAAHKMYETPIDKITCAHYYPLTDTLVTIKYTNAQIQDYLKKIVEEVWRIRKLKKVQFCAQQNEFCNWCSYKKYCPVFFDEHTVAKRIEEGKRKPKK